jgi:hypothetical protein
MKQFIASAAIFAATVSAIPVWQQCGGQNWSGSGSCDSGSSCVKLNDCKICRPTHCQHWFTNTMQSTLNANQAAQAPPWRLPPRAQPPRLRPLLPLQPPKSPRPQALPARVRLPPRRPRVPPETHLPASRSTPTRTTPPRSTRWPFLLCPPA